MPIANINNINLNYEITGRGKPIVCVHGYAGSTLDWENQIPVLSPNHTVVTLDLRGHGESAAPAREEEYSVPLFADDVFKLLEMLGIEKCCFMGHSLGGFIALQFALEHPDMLAALVLVATSSGLVIRDPYYVQLRQELDELARTQGVEAAFEYDAANNPIRVETFIRHPEEREIARRRVLATSVDGYIYASRAVGKWEPVTSRLSEIAVPTIIYWGDEDVLMAAGVQTLKKGIANSELVTVDGVGHSPHWESPGLFNETLLKFLGKIGW